MLRSIGLLALVAVAGCGANPILSYAVIEGKTPAEAQGGAVLRLAVNFRPKSLDKSTVPLIYGEGLNGFPPWR